MPYRVERSSECPPSRPWGVVGPNGVKGCHPTQDHANRQMAALYANEPALAEATAAPLDQRAHLGTFRVPPLDTLTDAEIDDLAGVLAETTADALEAFGHEVVRAKPEPGK